MIENKEGKHTLEWVVREGLSAEVTLRLTSKAYKEHAL